MAVGVIGVGGPGSHRHREQGQTGHHGVQARVGRLRQQGEAPGGHGGGQLQCDEPAGREQRRQRNPPDGPAVREDHPSLVHQPSLGGL